MQDILHLFSGSMSIEEGLSVLRLRRDSSSRDSRAKGSNALIVIVDRVIPVT